MRIKFIPLEKSKDNSTEILRNKIVEEIAKSIELNELKGKKYTDPVTGERVTTPGAAKRYAGRHGGGMKLDMGKLGTTEFTKEGEGQILRGPGKKGKGGEITAIRPGSGEARNRIPVRVRASTEILGDRIVEGFYRLLDNLKPVRTKEEDEERKEKIKDWQEEQEGRKTIDRLYGQPFKKRRPDWSKGGGKVGRRG